VDTDIQTPGRLMSLLSAADMADSLRARFGASEFVPKSGIPRGVEREFNSAMWLLAYPHFVVYIDFICVRSFSYV
jgi:hypothetical protein